MGVLARSFGWLAVWAILGSAAGARASGPPPLRVIVTLDVAAVAEARLGSARLIADQRARIRQRRRRLEQALAASGVRVLRGYERLPLVALEVPHADLPALAARDEVLEITGDRWFRPQLRESTQLIEAPVPWLHGYDGAGWHVAVLDTGVDAGHPAFEGRVDMEACFSAVGDCPGGATEASGPGSATPCAAPGCHHGTHVAGIVAGRDAIFTGVAPGAHLIAVQIFSELSGDICGGGTCPLAFTSDIVSGLEYVYGLRDQVQIAAVNMSLSGGSFVSQAQCDLENTPARVAIDQLRAAGIATVVAAGNSGLVDALGAPACISSAISVGSTTKAGLVSAFSNSASFLDLLAPGSRITSALPGGVFGTMSGTSMASPHVAGAWALRRELAPEASVDDVLMALKSTGAMIFDPGNALELPLIQLEADFVPEPGAAAAVGAVGFALGWLRRRAPLSHIGA